MAGYDVRRPKSDIDLLRRGVGIRTLRDTIAARKEAEAMKTQRQKHIPKSAPARRRVEEPKPGKDRSRDLSSRPEPENTSRDVITEEPTTQRPGFAERRKTVLGIFADVAREVFTPISDSEFDAAAKAKAKPHPEFG
jgi:hypothetical protein